MRKRIKLTNFKDFDTVYYNNLLSIPLLIVPSIIFEDWSAESLAKNLWVYFMGVSVCVCEWALG